MIYEKATYLSRIDEQHVLIATQIKTSCQSCSHNSECGTGVIAKTLAPKKNTVTAVCDFELVSNQSVIVEIREDQLLIASSLLYGLPLIVMLIWAVLGHWLFATDLMTALMAILGLFLGLGLAKRQTKKLQTLPRIVQIADVETFNCVESGD